jgi:hypothetical protein
MFTITFPEYHFRLKEENAKRLVFDIIRKKYVVTLARAQVFTIGACPIFRTSDRS